MKLVKFFILITTIVLSQLICSCSYSGNHNDDNISVAESALADDNFDRAQTICDKLISGDGLTTMSTDQLCRICLMYMKLAEVREQDTNTACAAVCIDIAIDKDSAAVDRFIAESRGDDHSMLTMARTLVGRSLLTDIKDEPIEVNDSI